METRRGLLERLGKLTAGGAATAIATHSAKNRAQAQGNSKNGKCQPPQHFRYSYTAYLFNECANEFVRMTVDFKYTVQTCIDPDGTTVFKIRAVSHGTGYSIDVFTDTPTGTNYILNGQDRVRQVVGPPLEAGCVPISSVEKYRVNLVSKGGSPNSVMTITSTFSVDLSCNVTFNNTFDMDCRG